MSRRDVSRWERPYAHLVRSDGPVRVVGDEPAPTGWVPRRFAGFASAPAEPVEAHELEAAPVEGEPLLWEGDQA